MLPGALTTSQIYDSLPPKASLGRNPRRSRSQKRGEQMRAGCSFRAQPAFRHVLRGNAAAAATAAAAAAAASSPYFSLTTAGSSRHVVGFRKSQRVRVGCYGGESGSRLVSCMERHLHSHPRVFQPCVAAAVAASAVPIQPRNQIYGAEAAAGAAVAAATITNSEASENLQQRSEEWHSLREGRLTASAFGTALGFWRGRRAELWEEKLGLRAAFPGNPATVWGATQESSAVSRYKQMTGNLVQHLGFKIYKEGDELHAWLGASPDGLIEGVKDSSFKKGGILEVKCPYNKGNPELGSPWARVPFYYMPQVQGLLEILDRDWMDFYVWTMNGSCIFRVTRDPDFWALIHRVMSEFWWVNVVPARHALSRGKEANDVSMFKPTDLHPLTGEVMKRSHDLATRCPLICRDVKGSIQEYVFSTESLL